ncbi:head HK97 family portal protein [Sphingobium jiangsuense]|uniref:phage portal protein n=1 Tax=Sphingobium jiangsuense TaxID=870476 RepID=UPI001CB70299|nr:phage portal protein [Sphingobium jiangsuense]GLT01504.1 head HK97 family portal protein [Sphingobium jiangsuense]
MFRLFSRQQPEASAPVADDVRAINCTADDETRSLASPEDWLLDLFGAIPAQAGVSVTPATAMRSTAVRAAVEAIAEAIGGLPLHVYERGEDGARDRATDHPAYVLLHDDANDWTPATSFREQLTRDALLHGNGYAFINRDRDGLPRELIRLRPDAVTVELDALTSEPRYRLNDGSGQRYLDRRDVLHIAAPSMDGVKGASPVQQCREAIALNIVMERHAARLFGRGARPSGILRFPGKLGAETAKRIKASWQAAHAGENSGGTAVLEEDGQFQALTLSSVDAQFLELWQHSILEIARIFRVPPHMLFELGRATWGNAAEMGATFLRFTLDRWLKAWQGEIRLKLIAPDDRARFYAEFLTDDLLRTDLGARADAYGKLIAARILNPNEVRAMENRAPYAGGDKFQNPNTTAGGAANAA